MALMALVFCGVGLPAAAIGLIRDPDIEHALKELARPVITAAGLSPSQIKILVVNDQKLNAFVVDTQHILLHSGLILTVKTAEELQAVLAHEVAHIANGHISRRIANLNTASVAARFGLLMALAVGAASGSAEAGAAVALGTASSASRVFLSHTRAEEASADQSALRYLATSGIDPTAMSDVLDYFRGQEVLSETRQDPYVRSHPLTRDRIRAVEGYAAAYAGRAQEHPQAQYWFLRAQGKLSAFLRKPGWTLQRVKSPKTDVDLMRLAVALHSAGQHEKGMAAMNQLIAARPGDPYYLELKGQLQLEGREFAAAASTYGAAANAAPGDPLILAGYGRALVATGQMGSAVGVLERARARDPADPRMLRDLAVAYAKTGNNGMASIVTAERYAVLGNLKTAAIHAKRAEALLPRGSPGWIRAQDVLSAAKSAGIKIKEG